MGALTWDLLWVRLHQQVPGSGRIAGRCVLAAVSIGLPIGIALERLRFPVAVALPVAVLLTGRQGVFQGEFELAHRLCKSTVAVPEPRQAARALTRIRILRRWARGRPSATTWLQINELRALVRLLAREGGGQQRREQGLLEARTLGVALRDQGHRSGAEGRPLDDEQLAWVLLANLELGRALRDSGIGAAHDSGERLLDEFVTDAEALLARYTGPVSTMLRFRLLWVRCEREVDRLFAAMLAADARVDTEGLLGLAGRWSSIRDLAADALRTAPPGHEPDGVILYAQAAFFAAEEDGVKGWDAFFDSLPWMSEEARADRRTLDFLAVLRATAMLERALLEEDRAQRLQRLGEVQSAAAALTPGPSDDGDGDALWLRVVRGRAWLARFSLTGEPRDLDEGLEAFTHAMRAPTSAVDNLSVAERLAGQATDLARHLDQNEDPTARVLARRCRRAGADAYRSIVDRASAPGRMAVLRAERQSPARLLAQAPQLGAELLLELGETGEAVVLLEEARQLALRGRLEDERSDAMSTKAGHPELARRREQVAGRLAALEEAFEASAHPAFGERTARGDLARAAGEARSELAALTQQARQVTGWRALDVDLDLVVAATEQAPLLYLFAGEDCGYAVLVASDGPRSAVRLPHFTLLGADDDNDPDAGTAGHALALRSAQARLGQFSGSEQLWRAQLVRTLNWLRAALEPLTNTTGDLATIEDLVLVPCGPAAQLPVHAVFGQMPDGGPRAVRYAPSALLLAEPARRISVTTRTPARDRRLLTVSVPHASPSAGVGPLQTVDSLTALARRLFPGHAGTDLGPARPAAPTATPPAADAGSDGQTGPATRHRVRRALTAHDVVLFGCHGVADDVDPLTGGLELADGRFTIRDVLALHIPRARLALVTACEGSLGDPVLHGELDSLSAALVEAGFVGVVAASWQVSELASYHLMTRFFLLWRDSPEESPARLFARAVQWLRTATRGDLPQDPRANRSPVVVNPTTALLEMPAFPEPDDWAAFSYRGA